MMIVGGFHNPWWLKRYHRASRKGDFVERAESIDDYESYLKSLTLRELKDVRSHLDKEKYPERYRLLTQELNERQRPQKSDRSVHRMSDAELAREYRKIDKIKYAARAIEIHAEISRRKTAGVVVHSRHGSAERSAQAKTQGLSLEFHGNSRDYFRIWIVNLCLTLLTFGIFSAWAKVRKKRYFYSHTTLDGTPFEYLGKPVPILKGRIVAVIGFGAYYFSSKFMTSFLPYVLGAGLIAAPWVLVRSAAFNARYSAFRNMTFHMRGTYADALKALYAYGIVPFFILSLMFDGFGSPYVMGGASFVFTVSIPFLLCRVRKFLVEFTSYGGLWGRFTATGGQYFKIYFFSGLIILAFLIPVGFLISFILVTPQMRWLVAYIGALPAYIGYVVGYAYIRSRSINLAWDSTKIGPLQFRSFLRFRELIALYLTNAIGIVVSCGLLIPWAVIRTMRYRVEHMEVKLNGDLSEFSGSKQEAVSAAGAETLDIFDWDLSL